MRSAWLAAPLAAWVTAVAGCASAPEDTVTSVVSDFREAVSSRDGGAACALLADSARLELEQSSGKPCEQAILDEVREGPASTGSAEVFGAQAAVGDGTDTVFLSRYDEGWRITGAACVPTAQDRPYDCSVTVG